MRKYFIFLLLLAFAVACQKSDAEKYKNSVSPATTGMELYIYGGQNGNDYLGKLDASKYDYESIWNTYGTYGNKYNSKSIWNKYGTYGNYLNSYSPFNNYATYPPILKDRYGRSHGYFTISKYKSNRANSKVADIICENYEKIREDVSGWYDTIFY